jgi:glutamate-ammonia-ligase adenylyltransferase
MSEPTAPESLARRLTSAPVLARPAIARDRLDALAQALAAGDPLTDMLARPAVAALLGAVADHSPFLWRLVTADPARLATCLAASPEAYLAACLDDMMVALSPPPSMADVMHRLRRAKQAVALGVALADLGGVWSVEQVTAALAAFADRAVQVALRVLLADAHRTGKLRLPDPARPEENCGLVILALGKQGAGELNYSSDIDIVAFFDPVSAAVPPAAAAAPVYVRITQALSRLLSERTADGYVLRVDLRLRPDPGSTAVAIGLPSAFAYYERYGQNWERAALIKARPVAGDLPLGATFLRDLSPFIWRKYFDYGAIADVHAMKRQIHAVRGHAAIAVAGHDVKLGRGGIREVEFFVQTQQLIFGGRRPHLRGSRTLDMLAALRRDGWIDESAVHDLGAAYRFLRGIEHRLQMIADEQTQRLPAVPEALAAFARFAGFPDEAAFVDRFMAEARAVERHYARLFEHAPALDVEAGSLVFTGVENDPETIMTLRALGFARPEAAAETVRGWHFGRRAAVRTERARERMTDLVPSLLATFGRSGDPDAALATFDTMLGRMPAAAELLSLLKSNAALLELFGDILGVAPRLAATIAARPHVLDAAIDPASLAAASDPALLEARLRSVLDPALPTEEFLDRARDLAQEEMFLIGVRLLSGTLPSRPAGEAYADLAAMIVRAAWDHCMALFTATHGAVEGGGCVVLAMGKLGSREMTASSDLDLILIYDFDPARPDSTGPRPLDAARYFTRLTQRLIAALTVATRRGRLYDVDMRLRPSGGQGPLATQWRSFVRYQAEEAATWERMALTRARVIAGDADLAGRVTAAIGSALTVMPDIARLRRDIVAMRGLIAREKGDAAPWDLKLARGGLLDIEFIAQGLVLMHAATTPALLTPSTADILQAARLAGLLDPALADDLIGAHAFLGALQQIARLTTSGPFDPTAAGGGALRRMALAVDLPAFSHVEAQRTQDTRAVRAAFVAYLGDPEAAG